MKRRLVLVAGCAAVTVVLGWYLSRVPNPLSVDTEQICRVEVRFESWGEDAALRPDTASEDREAIAALVTVIRSGRDTTDHKCGSCGVVTLRQSVGRPIELRFLPGHHPEWYEFRSDNKVYRVPREEFVAAMRRVGVEVPLECQ